MAAVEARRSADTLKKLSLELGGNAPFIVFDDADLDAAAEGAIVSKYRNSGQTCVCANRLFVHDKVYDAFAAKLVEKVKALKAAPGTEPGATQGPLIDAQALAKVEEHVADAKALGARVLHGGARHERGGTFYQPTVLADVKPEMKIFRAFNARGWPHFIILDPEGRTAAAEGGEIPYESFVKVIDAILAEGRFAG